jgi:hypothetical protein
MANLRDWEVEEIRKDLEAVVGTVWNTTELTRDFDVLGFQAPYVVAREKASGKLGSLRFQHYPRFYYNWKED